MLAVATAVARVRTVVEPLLLLGVSCGGFVVKVQLCPVCCQGDSVQVCVSACSIP